MSFLPQINLSYPVRVAIGSVSTGSGFFYLADEIMYLVTARHVLFRHGLELYGPTAELTGTRTDSISGFSIELDLAALENGGNLRKHDRADVAIARIANWGTDRHLYWGQGVRGPAHDPLIPGGIVGLSRDYTQLFNEVEVSNHVLMFGYPSSLGSEAQIDRTKPLLRYGMIAGKTEDRRIVLDCAVYFGNSGALILETERFRGIGVATEAIPFVEHLYSKQFKKDVGIRYENSGYALIEPIDRINELLPERPASA